MSKGSLPHRVISSAVGAVGACLTVYETGMAGPQQSVNSTLLLRKRGPTVFNVRVCSVDAADVSIPSSVVCQCHTSPEPVVGLFLVIMVLPQFSTML